MSDLYETNCLVLLKGFQRINNFETTIIHKIMVKVNIHPGTFKELSKAIELEYKK